MKSLGLADVIAEISKPGSFNEWDSPLVMATYCMYCWRETLGEIMARWTHVDVQKTFPTEVLMVIFT
jgi:hypothetical protein